jgi:hypothetical protein
MYSLLLFDDECGRKSHVSCYGMGLISAEAIHEGFGQRRINAVNQ